MLLDLLSADLHESLFLHGTNLGTKLDPSHRAELKLQFDDQRDRLHVWYKGKFKLIKNWATIEPLKPEEFAAEPKRQVKLKKPQTSPDANPNIKAQVSTPHDHVFAEGPGFTGVGQRVK